MNSPKKKIKGRKVRAIKLKNDKNDWDMIKKEKIKNKNNSKTDIEHDLFIYRFYEQFFYYHIIKKF
jgi:hypothetical protein